MGEVFFKFHYWFFRPGSKTVPLLFLLVLEKKVIDGSLTFRVPSRLKMMASGLPVGVMGREQASKLQFPSIMLMHGRSNSPR